MFVPPELATRRVSGLFETARPQGNEPTATPLDANVLVEFCQTSSWLKSMLERNTCPRTGSTAMSPIVPLRGSGYVLPYTTSDESESAALSVGFGTEVFAATA